jgi:uncharacterized protein
MTMTMQQTNWQAICELAEDLDVLATDVARSSTDHGPRHWRDVARVGLGLWAEGVGIKDEDMTIVLLFAMLHDTQRHNEFADPEHGARAAGLAAGLGNSGGLLDWLDNERAMRLSEALTGHDKGGTIDANDDAAIALCWDADRLTLPRVGITPEDRYLSTEQATDSTVKGAVLFLVTEERDYEWARIINAYEKLQPLELLHPALPVQHARAVRNARLEYGRDLMPEVRLDESGSTAVVRSKFVQDIYMGPPMHVYYNARYQSMSDLADEYLAEGEWERFVLCHEKPYRLDAIYEATEAGMRPHETAEQVGSHWVHSENIWQQEEQWIDLWIAARDGGHLERAMDEEERAKLDALPEQVTVYRGYQRRGRDEGLSWTLERRQAEWFAWRWWESRSGEKEPDYVGPHVAVGTVRRTDILAYFAGRGEEEIVVLPEDVTIEEHYKVTGKIERHPADE